MPKLAGSFPEASSVENGKRQAPPGSKHIKAAKLPSEELVSLLQLERKHREPSCITKVPTLYT